jgi:CHAT domain-containing protein
MLSCVVLCLLLSLKAAGQALPQAQAYFAQGLWQHTLQALHQDSSVAAEILRGKMFLELYEFTEAQKCFEKARIQQQGEANTEALAATEAYLLKVYSGLRQNQVALLQAQKLEVFLTKNKTSKALNLLLYEAIGTAYRIQWNPPALSKAFDYYQKALHLAAGSPEEIQLLHFLGNWYNDQMAYLGGTLASSSSYEIRISTLAEMDKLYLLALASYQQALTLCERWLPAKHSKKAFLYFGICAAQAKVVKQEADVLRVLHTIQEGLQAVLYDYTARDPYAALPKALLYTSLPALSYLLQFRADMLGALYRRNGQEQVLQAAYSNYKSCVRILDELQYYYPQSHLHLTMMNAYNNATYINLMALAHELWQKKDDAKYLEEAFWYSEKSKYALLTQNKTMNRDFAALSQKAYWTERRYLAQATAAEQAAAQNQLQILLQEEKSQQQSIGSLQALQEKIPADMAIISYTDGRAFNNAYFVLLLTKSKAVLLKIPKTKHWELIEQDIESLQEALLQHDASGFATKAFGIYEQCLQPIATQLQAYKKLLIIPDGKLAYLPFEALLSSPATGQSFQKMPFLIHQWQIQYGFSIHLSFSQEAVPTSAQKVFWIPQFPKDSLTPLPYQQRLATLLQEKYQFTAQNPTQDLVNQQSGTVLHISTHALINYQSPEASALWLPQKLLSGQVEGLSMAYRLVLLNTCESSRGKVQMGEGVWSLARAFKKAGAESLMATLWQADDRSIAAINTYFYEHLADGYPSDEALHKAKKRFLEQAEAPEAYNPYYWAVLIHLGAPQQIYAARAWWQVSPWVIGVLGAMLLFIGIFYKWSTSQRRAISS